jgi:hypothetical protein
VPVHAFVLSSIKQAGWHTYIYMAQALERQKSNFLHSACSFECAEVCICIYVRTQSEPLATHPD